MLTIAQGLRGLASATVVITHLARSFDEELFSPTVSENGPSRFLQWPFIRVLIQGRIGVAIFSMVTGYVCALKPIKLCREGNQEAALSSISRSALRRVPRVVIPPALATSLVWVITQLGAFNVAKHSGSSWISSTSPGTWPTAQETVYDLINNIALTWTHTQNSYDPNQWTLLPLLKGGMMIYVFILATCNLAPRYRMMATLGMWLYFHRSNDCMSLPNPPSLTLRRRLTLYSHFWYAILLGGVSCRASNAYSSKRFHNRPSASLPHSLRPLHDCRLICRLIARVPLGVGVLVPKAEKRHCIHSSPGCGFSATHHWLGPGAYFPRPLFQPLAPRHVEQPMALVAGQTVVCRLSPSWAPPSQRSVLDAIRLCRSSRPRG